MSWRTAAFLWAGRLSITTMSPSDRVGTRHCRRYSTKIAPVIARSMTKGAVIASWRSAARKVIVFQWPHGTRPTTRWPRRARPRSRAIAVEVPVSSINTSRVGSRAGWSSFHAARAAATSGRSCSLACTIFFEADPLGGEQPPHRPVPDMDAALGKLGPDLLQRQIRNRRDPPQQPVPLILQARVVIATHRLGRQAAALAPYPNPLDYRTGRQFKHCCRFATRQAPLNRPNYPRPQIPRIWSCHACWPPSQHAA